jgi:hypothetical protein
MKRREVAEIGAILLVLAALAGCAAGPRSFIAGPRRAACRIAILPLANYSGARDAAERVAPILASEIGRLRGIEVVDAGAVEAALAKEPWLLLDRLPPDLIDRFGEELGSQAILVGSVLSCGFRESGSDAVPQFALSLRLLETPGGRVLWSAVHSRDGEDGEMLFGIGRVKSLEQLETHTVKEIFETFPPPSSREPRKEPVARGGER